MLASPRRRVFLVTSLLAEAIIGFTLVFVLAARLDLNDFAVVLPVFVVVGGAGLLAFATRSRILFWCGSLGATVGGVWPKPRFHVAFNPNADPAEVAVIWSRMVGELNLQYALVCGIIGVAIAYRVIHVLRHGVSRK